MTPGLPALEVFVAVARHGSFRKAASERGVSTSALSHVIRGLEQNLGVRLFHRTNRSIRITDAGAHLLARIGPVATRQIERSVGSRPVWLPKSASPPGQARDGCAMPSTTACAKTKQPRRS